ncbi:MAG: class I SAM-dependent methyltransferase [Herbaspirillum sp.]|jgi:SAM-dependent methyltransferase|nr:class I SAM-dependent methyltransferase [Herbaspirillum sp.]MBO18392.1 class I SAM-dependent methyltransferase [Herbaspirillum sp.]MCP3653471.1 class I SAM-dependent methyltransferase [Herbaspirillum sp.]MCP3946882.1 class I SAM-dependent methyltransferase [Herbaspirillum sp.]MCP4031359.1 class I SAM-dependent methyltransferase [Herbaspirillum sp.]|tara:strand:- start:3316 stop:4122 length:807 start_codon:yes stop_codon:yes gene_type:complete
MPVRSNNNEKRKGKGNMEFTYHNILLDNGTYTKPDTILLQDHPQAISARKVLNLAFPGNRRNYRIIDLGCLEGGYTVEFARMGFESIGLEVREENFACCNYVKQNLNLQNLHFVKDTAWNLDRYGPFDASFCCGLLYHFDKPRAFLEKLARHTKKVMILQTHFSTSLEDGVKYYSLSPMQVNEGLNGRWYHEFHPSTPYEEREKLRWASYENDRSFWIQKEHLLGLIHDLGFTTVFEQYDNWAPNMGENLEKNYAGTLRSTFVGIRDL